MLQATHTNGLTGPDVQPWHLKASYRFFDQDGNAKGRGEYEELWVSQAKFKSSFSGEGFSQTRFGTDKVPLQTGDETPPPWQLDTLRYDLVTPLPPEDSLDGWDFAGQPAKPGDNSRCISMSGPLHGSISASGATSSSEKAVLGVFCFDAVQPVLKTHEQGTTTFTTFSNPVTLQGHWLPHDLEMKVKGKVVLSAHLEVFETLSTVNEADFTPPAGATRAIRVLGTRSNGKMVSQPGHGQLQISADKAHTNLVTKVAPIYPPIARAARVQGTVVLQAVIGKDGHVNQLNVVSGPAMLQQAAMDAVKQWIYKPYLLNGAPVEVITTVNIVFQLSNPSAKPETPGDIPAVH
jgi:TonB family protein